MITMMKAKLHYSRSPLTEALIDIRVALPDGTPVETLASMQAGQETLYPQRRKRVQFAGQFSVNAEEPSGITSQVHDGYIFSSEDGRQVVQARLDGFTFSRLAPYENWESFQGEARRLWKVYRSIARPETITRLAVRYINHLNLPLPIEDFNHYLRTIPEISSDLPQSLSGYFMQLQIPQPDLQAMLILNEALLESTIEDNITILLDIDIFRDTDIPNDEEGV
ncbi:MAG: TIGR04255 family protein, partial [Roseiflexaceae bacterium]